MAEGVTNGNTLIHEKTTVSLSDLKIAIAHWNINTWGGAEYLVTHLADALNCEQIYTLGNPTPDDSNPYVDVNFVDVIQDLSPTLLRRLQAKTGRIAEYALWEDIDWRKYGSPDVLITSGATTRAVITPDNTLHLNYCHSPPRWFYDLYHDRKNSIVGQLARPLLRYLRMRDATVDLRVDDYFANSPVVARRISKFYNRDSQVIYPPVDTSAYESRADEEFYLHLGRLDAEKGVPAVVEAFAESNHHLVLAGGRGDIDETVISQIHNANTIDYQGFVDKTQKHELLATCRAVIFNGHNEDFGIVPIEANASGKAVLTRNEGFPAIFVNDGENGFHHDGSSAGIQDAIERFEHTELSGNPMERVAQFDVSAFSSQVREQVERRYNEFNYINAPTDQNRS